MKSDDAAKELVNPMTTVEINGDFFILTAYEKGELALRVRWDRGAAPFLRDEITRFCNGDTE